MASKIHNTDLSENDTIILLIGPTGTGKSTFINKATNSGIASTSVGLFPKAGEVQAFRSPRSKFESVVFVDTPGFDGSHSNDKEVLNKIYTWLSSIKSPVPKFAGVLYFWNISVPRADRTSMQIVERFRSLCGHDALRNTVFVMSLWNVATPSDRESRCKELREKYLWDMVSKDAQILPFEDSFESAWNIVDQLPVPACSLLIQEEITRKKSFSNTRAAKELHPSNERLFPAWKDLFSKLRKLF